MSIAVAMKVPAQRRDLDWLKTTLQYAIDIEHSTIPPYLCAMWSIKNRSDPVYRMIRRIVLQEMLHMGLACNILSAVGGTPKIADHAFFPSYPGPLPHGVHPGLVVGLEPLSMHALETFRAIELPEPKIQARRGGYPTIGVFYNAISKALGNITPPMRASYQVTHPDLGGYDLVKITNVEEAQKAIKMIKRQGEGTRESPLRARASNIVAHYFRFGEILFGREYVKQPDETWAFVGAPVPFPAEIYPMAPVPMGGYPSPPPAMEQFNRLYTGMLQALQRLWTTAAGGELDEAVKYMRGLRGPAVELMKIRLPNSELTYGPTFKYVP